MNKDEYDLQTQRTIVELFRYTLRLHCRHEVTKGLLLATFSKDPAILEKLAAELKAQAEKMEEGILLGIGDSNPQAADLLGIQEFLRKLK